jgi:hypothetical protein
MDEKLRFVFEHERNEEPMQAEVNRTPLRHPNQLERPPATPPLCSHYGNGRHIGAARSVCG